MYFCRGSLPWQGLKATTKVQKYERISEKKFSTPLEVLCKGFPTEFATYLSYVRALRFEDKPDYAYLRKLFRDLFFKEGYQNDFVFDWTVKKINEGVNAERPTTMSSQNEEDDMRQRQQHQQQMSSGAVYGSSSYSPAVGMTNYSSSSGVQALDSQHDPRRKNYVSSGAYESSDPRSNTTMMGDTISSGMRRQLSSQRITNTSSTPTTTMSGSRSGMATYTPTARVVGDSSAKYGVTSSSGVHRSYVPSNGRPTDINNGLHTSSPSSSYLSSQYAPATNQGPSSRTNPVTQNGTTPRKTSVLGGTTSVTKRTRKLLS